MSFSREFRYWRIYPAPHPPTTPNNPTNNPTFPLHLFMISFYLTMNSIPSNSEIGHKPEIGIKSEMACSKKAPIGTLLVLALSSRQLLLRCRLPEDCLQDPSSLVGIHLLPPFFAAFLRAFAASIFLTWCDFFFFFFFLGASAEGFSCFSFMKLSSHSRCSCCSCSCLS